MIDHPDLHLLEKTLKTDLIGHSIQKFTFLQVNPQYFEFDENSVWVLDGGVEINLSNGKTISYAWNKVVELMDLVQDNATMLLEDLDFYELDKVNEIINAALANKVIQSVDFEWNWYQMMDDNFELEEELHFAPLGIQLTFDDGQSLQLASVQFGLEDRSIANLSYLPEGDLLVSLNRNFSIHLNDDEA